MTLGKNKTREKNEMGSNIIFPMILRRISSGEEAEGDLNLGKKIGVGEEYTVVENLIHAAPLIIYIMDS